MKVFQLVEGRHDHHHNQVGQTVLPDHTGAVTLLYSAEAKILIDVGSRAAWPEVLRALGNRGLTPDDIDVVLLTHLHLDHSFNIAHFNRAQVVAWAHDWTKHETIELVPDLNRRQALTISDNINAIPSSGHDECMNSFFITGGSSLQLVTGENINLGNKTLCVSGDAINQAVIDSGGQILPFTYNSQEYLEGVKAILKQDPDYILPGHGPLIYRPEDGWPKLTC